MAYRIVELNEVQRLLRKKTIPARIIEKYQTWKDLVSNGGLPALRALPALNLHALKGQLEGLYTCYLTLQWRVIFAIDENERVLLVTVHQVTAHHYKKAHDMNPQIRDSLNKVFESFRTPKGAKLARRNTKVSVGHTVRNLREFAGLTQAALAKKADVQASWLSAVENERVNLGTMGAKRLARVLGVSPAFLLFPNG